MKAPEWLKKIANSPFFVLATGVASIAGLIAVAFNDATVSLIAGCYMALLSLVTIIYILKRYFNIRHIRSNIEKQYENIHKEVSSKMHKFDHDYRDSLGQLNQKEIITKEHFDIITKDICNNIQEFFRILLGCTVSVCIKSITATSSTSKNVDGWELMVLARSSSSDSDRSKNDDRPIKVSENTDFKIILTEDKHQENYFASANLETTVKTYNGSENESIKFKNSTENYLDKYKSTIVVPIRIKRNKVSHHIANCTPDSAYHVMGFLCIDSLSTFDKQIALFTMATMYAKGFGDSLYVFFETYYVRQVIAAKEKDEKKKEKHGHADEKGVLIPYIVDNVDKKTEL